VRDLAQGDGIFFAISVIQASVCEVLRFAQDDKGEGSLAR
jgi:hypothetical protein